jgi:phosphoribosylaminoimidazole-succinocarboxamide synthase
VLDERLQVFVGKVERDDEYIANLDAATRSLLQEVDETISRLMAKVSGTPESKEITIYDKLKLLMN